MVDQLQHRSLFAITACAGFEQPGRAPRIPAINILLSLCLMPKPVRLPSSPMNLCGCPSLIPVLEARTVIKGAGTQLQQLPAFSITPQDIASDPMKRCFSQES